MGHFKKKTGVEVIKQYYGTFDFVGNCLEIVGIVLDVWGQFVGNRCNTRLNKSSNNCIVLKRADRCQLLLTPIFS